MASIQSLHPKVAEQLHASLIIHSFAQCVAELVQNSLDAEATTVEVRVDIANHSVVISDNGSGITSANMAEIGARFATSKCHTLSDLQTITTFGFRGEAIAAIAELSLLDIVSKPSMQDRPHSVILKGGRRLFYGPSNKSPRYGSGTTIAVRDLFYMLPVRQKLWSDASLSRQDAEFDKVKKAVETIALVVPQVSFTVVDVSKQSKIVSYPRADSIQRRVSAVIGQASLPVLYPLNSKHDSPYKISGVISISRHPNRLLQHIYLNNRPIRHSDITKVISRILQLCAFPGSSSSLAESDKRRPKEIHILYLLQITCCPSLVDIYSDPTKRTVEFEDDESVIALVIDTLVNFLERQNLLSRTAAVSLRSGFRTKKRPLKSGYSFSSTETLSGIDFVPYAKYSRPSSTGTSRFNVDRLPGDSQGEELDIEDELEFELDRDLLLSEISKDSLEAAFESQPSSNKGCIGPSQFLESRTWVQDALARWVNPTFSTAPTTITALHQTLRNKSRSTIPDSNHDNGRVSRFFDSPTRQGQGLWESDIQFSKEHLKKAKVVAQLDSKYILCSIPDADLSSSLSTAHGDGFSNTGHGHQQIVIAIDQHAADERARVERLMMGMCVCTKRNSALNTTDPQIQGQQILHRLDRVPLVPPLPITLTSREWDTAASSATWLQRWGFTLEHGPTACNGYSFLQGINSTASLATNAVYISQHFKENIDATSNVQPSSTPGVAFDHEDVAMEAISHGYVTWLPSIVADRCIADRSLLKDLVQSVLVCAEENPIRTAPSLSDQSKVSNDSQGWFRCLLGCPKGILEIVNSKACRGAIMFNDELDQDELEQLVRDLSGCLFPFQCAHGRPSVIPLVGLGQGLSRRQELRAQRANFWGLVMGTKNTL